MVLLAGIVITVKDRDGNVIARLFGPAGGTVEVENVGAAGQSQRDEPLRPQRPLGSDGHDSKHRLPLIPPLAMVQRPTEVVAPNGNEVEGYTIETLPIMGHVTAAVADNGARFATFSDDSVIRIWDSHSRELVQVLLGHGAGPGADG